MEPKFDRCSDVDNAPRTVTQGRWLTLLQIALRVTFFIVGPIPVIVLVASICAAIEVITELIAWDTSYYQDHSWCPFLACVVAGTACFVLRRVPYLESGRWIGPLVVALSVYMLFD